MIELVKTIPQTIPQQRRIAAEASIAPQCGVRALPAKHTVHACTKRPPQDTLADPMEPSALQLQAAMHLVASVLTSDNNEALRAELLQELEHQTGLTIRTPQQESALRNLAELADIKADLGLAEKVSLEDADIWYDSKFAELREESRLPLRREEVVEFLARSYENCAEGACRAVQVHDNGRARHAVVFTWAGDEPHPAIEHMLDVMDIDSARTSFRGEDAIVGFLDDR